MKSRNKNGVITSIIGGAINAILGGIKFYIGLATNSVSILSDGINNFGDVISNIGGGIGLGVSGKEPTKKHPYGFKKAEDIATLFVATILILVGLAFIYNSIERLVYRRPVYFSWLYFYLVCFTLLIKLIMGIGYHLANKKINSDIIKCNKLDSFLDAGITFVAILGYTFSQFIGFPLDAIIGIIIGIFIVINGIKLLKGAVSKLIGENNEEIKNIILDILKNEQKITKINEIVVFENGLYSSVVANIDANFNDIEEVKIYKNEIKNQTGYTIYFEGKIIK